MATWRQALDPGVFWIICWYSKNRSRPHCPWIWAHPTRSCTWEITTGAIHRDGTERDRAVWETETTRSLSGGKYSCNRIDNFVKIHSFILSCGSSLLLFSKYFCFSALAFGYLLKLPLHDINIVFQYVLMSFLHLLIIVTHLRVSEMVWS